MKKKKKNNNLGFLGINPFQRELTKRLGISSIMPDAYMPKSKCIVW